MAYIDFSLGGFWYLRVDDGKIVCCDSRGYEKCFKSGIKTSTKEKHYSPQGPKTASLLPPLPRYVISYLQPL
jgi:hypothetical protein